MSTKSSCKREKTKNTRKQYIDITTTKFTIFKQREQTSISRNTTSYYPSMIDLLPSNFLDIADRSSKTDVSNTEQSSSLVYPRNNFNSNRNSNSNSKINNKNVKVIDETIKEIDQSYQKVDNTTGQGVKISLLLNKNSFADVFDS